MLTLSRWLLAPSLLLGGLALIGPVYAQKTAPVTVQDDAGFFSKGAEEKANLEIARIKREFKKDLVIETIKESPPRPENVSKDPKSDSYIRFFDNWAIQRAKNHHINGVGVFLLKDPPIIRVVEDTNTQGKLFTQEDGNQLRSKIIEKLKAKDNDGALTTAVAFVHDTMARHQQASAPNQGKNQVPNANPVPARQAAEIPWLKYVLIGLAVLIVLWIVMAIIRGLSRAAGGGGGGMAPGMGGGGGGGGGGGFLTGFLGGMFGAAAGMWMYNNFFGGHGSSAWASSPGAEPTAGGADQGPGADYGVSGGDYGADGGGKQEPDWSGGGNAGGGDAGGGDWGGSDAAGGGGGDWGGGGGDWGGGGGGDWGGGGGGGDW